MSFLSRFRRGHSNNPPSCSAVIAAAGSSARMGGVDKLFIEINGAPVLAYTLTAFQTSKYVDEIIIVSRRDSIEQISEI